MWTIAKPHSGVTVAAVLQYMAGTVGPPLPSTDMRLEAVPEMNYNPTGNPPRGEILFRGPSVFSGYYRDEEKTAEVLGNALANGRS